MDDRVIPLAADFPRATRDDWLALAAKTLKGADMESLVRLTADGLSVQPIYAADRGGGVPPAQARRGEGLDVRASVRHPDPATANAQILEALEGGAASVLLAIDPAGAEGVAVGSAEALAALLDGVKTDIATVALDAGFLGPSCADWLAAAAKASPAAPLALHLDPLTAFAQAGVSPGPIESHLAAAANLAARLAEPFPRASLFLASGRAVHETGGSAGEELAFAAASALAYAKALVGAGLDSRSAFARIALGLAVDAEPLVSLPKLRAARLIWRRLTGACGVELPARIEARSSRRMLTMADPWTNLVRLTAAGFAAIAGGADALVLGAFTGALGPPTAFARRLARNTALILLEEAHIGKVADPLAGAWAVESLTRDLARAGWERFTAIEGAGGVVEALRAGAVAGPAVAARVALAQGLASREIRIVGVTDFVNAAPHAVEVEPAPAETSGASPDARLPGPDSRCPPLALIQIEALAA